MANAITPVELSRNGQSAKRATAVAVSTSTGAYVDVSDFDASKLILEVSSTGEATGYIRDGAQYTGGTIGDLKITSTGALTYFIGPLETHRFKDDDGYINIAGDTGSTGDLSYVAILLP